MRVCCVMSAGILRPLRFHSILTLPFNGVLTKIHSLGRNHWCKPRQAVSLVDHVVCKRTDGDLDYQSSDMKHLLTRVTPDDTWDSAIVLYLGIDGNVVPRCCARVATWRVLEVLRTAVGRLVRWLEGNWFANS